MFKKGEGQINNCTPKIRKIFKAPIHYLMNKYSVFLIHVYLMKAMMQFRYSNKTRDLPGHPEGSGDTKYI